MLPDYSYSLELIEQSTEKCKVGCEMRNRAFCVQFPSIVQDHWATRFKVVVIHPVSILVGADRRIIVVDRELQSSKQEHLLLTSMEREHTET